MKNVGSIVRLISIAAILSLVAIIATGCGDEKQDKVSVDQSVAANDGDSGDQADQGQTRQFKSGEKVGSAGKVVINSDADFTKAQQEVIARLGDFADATANHDYEKICNDLLSKAASKIGGDCVATLSKTGKQIKDFKISVNSVQISKDGKSAKAKVDVTSNVNKTEQPQDMSMTKEGGQWRVQILGQ
jgi:hypothetical protein